jgi:hypothetical protein
MTFHQFLLCALFLYVCWHLYRKIWPAQTEPAETSERDVEVMSGIASKILNRIDGWEALPVFESNFELEPDEVAHLEAPASLVGLRTVKSTTVYHGPSVRVPIARGVSYRAGAITYSTQRDEDWCVVDKGGVCVTNRRIFFHGMKGNSVVRLSKIIKTYGGEAEAVRLDRENGKPFIIRSPYALMITAIVQRLLADQRDGIVSDRFNIEDAAKKVGILPAQQTR